MHWEKEIRIRITWRRMVGTVLAASTVANLLIAAVVLGVDPSSTLLATSVSITPPSTSTFSLPTDTMELQTELTVTQSFASPPSDTPDVIPTDTSTPIEVTQGPLCIKKFYWPTYLVKDGDTLSDLAAAIGSTVYELMSANCLLTSKIYVGQVLYVPRLLPGTITNTSTTTASATESTSQTPTPTDTPTNPPTDVPSSTPTQTLTNTITPSATPMSTHTSQWINTPTVFQNWNGLLCNSPSSVSLSVLVYDPDLILGVTALLYDGQNRLVAQMPMQWFGNLYTLSRALPVGYTVYDVSYYQFSATDIHDSTTLSLFFYERSSNCFPTLNLDYEGGFTQ